MNHSGKIRSANAQPVTIVGGGIIGLLTAYELVQAGVQVSIFDRQALAQESSWAGGGILSPLYPWRYPEAVTVLAAWSQQRYPELVAHLENETGIDAQYIRSGLLLSVPNELEIALKWSENHRISLESLDAREARKLQTGLAGDGEPWAWMPEIAQVRNPRLLQALKEYLLKNGVNFVENTAISGFIDESGRLTGIATEQGRVLTDRCLVAAGAWSGQLMAKAGVQLPVEPVRGQMLLLQAKPGDLQHIVLKDNHYLIPRADGRILVGSTLEYAGFDKSITAAARDELLDAAETIIPGITSKGVVETQWAGLRPGSPEGIPYIGEHPDTEGLFVCSGHFRNGFVLGPASARLATDLLLDREPAISPLPYQLAR